MVKAKAAAASVRIPQNRDEAAKMISEFGAAALRVAEIETAMRADLAKVKKDAEKKAKTHVDKAADLFAGLKLYCEANRQALLGDSGVKTVDFGTGKASWRFKPAKVTLSGEVEDIVALIIDKAENTTANNSEAFLAFLRRTVGIDKEAMLKNPDLARTIEGVRVGSGGEVFEVEPFGAEISEAAQ
jgi:phage host-nuclease inhibitor protein Gam